MNKVPVPQEDNTVQSLARALSRAAFSAVPVAGSLINEFIDRTNRKLIEDGHRIFLEEVSKGRVELSDHEKEAVIPIGYRYYRAAQEGTVSRNLRLLARLIRKQIDDKELSYEKYVTLDNAIRDLSLEEMIALAEICKPIHGLNIPDKHLESGGKEGKGGIAEQIKAFINYMQEHYSDHFSCEYGIVSNLISLSGKGLTIPIDNFHWRPTYPHFVPTKLALTIMEKVETIDLNTEEVQIA